MLGEYRRNWVHDRSPTLIYSLVQRSETNWGNGRRPKTYLFIIPRNDRITKRWTAG